MSGEDDEYLKALEIQRRNFESQFGSLETMGFEDKSKSAVGPQSDNSSEESNSDGESDEESDEAGFKGFSDSSEDPAEESSEEEIETAPKVIKFTDSYTSGPTLSKKDQKLARSGRAPAIAELEEKERKLSKLTAKQLAQHKKEDDDNLENDVKLQRLLQESHILSRNLQYSGAALTMETIDYEEPTGKARKKALTSRMRNLAATNSSNNGFPKTLEKMPMSMRKGMIKSREKKIAKYEQEAKDAGIILSKTRKGELRDLDIGKGSTFSSDRLGSGKKQVQRVRDRGLKINSIGRSTKNGLILSKDEISRISNAGNRNNNKKRKR